MRSLSVFALSILISALHATEPDPESSVEYWIKTAEQQARLNSGQVIVLETVDNTKGGEPDHAATAAILIHAPLSSVWDVVNDQDEAPKYIKTLLSSKPVKEEEGYSLLHQQVKVGFHKVSYVVKHMPTPPSVINFERVSGDLKSMDGFWRFIPVADETSERTLLIYRLSLKPDFPVPAFLIRKSLSDNLPDTLISVKNEVLKGLAGQ